MSVAEVPVARPRWAGRLLRGVLDLLVGSLMCLTPVTAVVALGWIMRRMHVSTARALGQAPERTGWVLGSRGRSWSVWLVGGLAANIRDGTSAMISLSLATLPFSALWLLAWWAGWDNSFNKGYEQAWVGPLLFLIGNGVFLVVMIHLPLALAHQAATGRWLAVFEWPQVRSALRNAGWGYVLLAMATVVFALPLLASRGLPVFVEQIIPGFADFSPEEVEGVGSTRNLIVAAYVFATVWWLRTWAARLYARSIGRAASGPDAHLWPDAVPSGSEPPSRAGRLLRLVLLAGIWFGLVVMIVVGQFLNHSWWAWLQHPAFGLPWLG